MKEKIDNYSHVRGWESLLKRTIYLCRYRQEHPEDPITDEEAFKIMDEIDQERKNLIKI